MRIGLSNTVGDGSGDWSIYSQHFTESLLKVSVTCCEDEVVLDCSYMVKETD